MKTLYNSIALQVLVMLCSTSAAYAQVTYSTLVPPSSLTAGDQYFDASVGGLRDYLDSIEETERGLYRKLDPKVSALETQRALAWVIGIAGATAGTAVAVWPAFTSDPHDTPTTTGLAVGGSIVVVSVLLAFVMLPGRSDVMDVVNMHNRMGPNEPLHLQLGRVAPHDGIALLRW